MCSICGGNISKELVKKASSAMTHRGPDASGMFADEVVSLAHNRLSILDLSDNANQPFVYKNFVIVYNGEIYNFKELIIKYEIPMQTRSDTEVVAYLYAKLGKKAFYEFNGMFAICIYDIENKKLFLIRDRFGKKPLYYFFDGKTFIFASEIKAILKALEHTPNINKQAFTDYLSFLTPGRNQTFYENIYKMEPGQSAVFDLKSKKLEISRYYELAEHIGQMDITRDEALANIEKLLLQSVRYRLVSDVPVASFLSGGLDSTLISAMYKTVNSGKIDTFSIGYDDFKQYDELEYARIASAFIGSNHHELIASRDSFVDAFEEILDTLDEPINDSAIIPTFMLSKIVHQNGYKVILSGEGSDEIFFGYDSYFDHLGLHKINNELSSVSKQFMSTYHAQYYNDSKAWEYLRRVYDGDQPIFRMFGECFSDRQKQMLSKTLPKVDIYAKELYEKFCCDEYSKWMSYIDIKHWIGEVLMTKMDRMSMSHSLESRAPFLDYKLVEFVMSLPSELRVGSTTKNLLKEIAIGYIPKEIVYRQKKGFSSPHFEWYYETYGSKILDDFRLVNKQLGWFEDEFLTFLYKQGKIGKFKQHTWGLIVFCRWFMKRFM